MKVFYHKYSDGFILFFLYATYAMFRESPSRREENNSDCFYSYNIVLVLGVWFIEFCKRSTFFSGRWYSWFPQPSTVWSWFYYKLMVVSTLKLCNSYMADFSCELRVKQKWTPYFFCFKTKLYAYILDYIEAFDFNLRHPKESLSELCIVRSLYNMPKHEQKCSKHRLYFICFCTYDQLTSYQNN